MSNLIANTQQVTKRWTDKKRRTVTVADAYCPTCGILVPDLERLRAENEALRKQLEEKRLDVAANGNGLGLADLALRPSAR